MTEALRMLGYKVYDFDNNCYELLDDWLKIYERGGTKEDFRRMYNDVDAASDLPACYFWEEMHEAFPEAKIILTVKKSEDLWLASWLKQIRTSSPHIFRMLTLTYTGFRYTRLLNAVGRVVFGCRRGWPWQLFVTENHQILKRRYRDHTNGVLQRAPKEKLLVFKIEDGWGPLCHFLGKELPSVSFPHENKKGDAFERRLPISPMFRQMEKELYISYTVILVVFGVIIYNLFYLLNML